MQTRSAVENTVNIIREVYQNNPTSKIFSDAIERHEFRDVHFKSLFEPVGEKLNENIKFALAILEIAPLNVKSDSIKIFVNNDKIPVELRLQQLKKYNDPRYLKPAEYDALIKKLNSPKPKPAPIESPWGRLKQIEGALANPVLRRDLNLEQLKAEHDALTTLCSQGLAKHAIHLSANKGPETLDSIQQALDSLENFIHDDILTTANLDERILRIERYIKLWAKAHNSGNYLTSCAIYNALHHPDIVPMTKTFDSLSEEAKAIKNKIDNEFAKSFPRKSKLTAENVVELNRGNRSPENVAESSRGDRLTYSTLQPKDVAVLDPIKNHEPLSPRMNEHFKDLLINGSEDPSSTSRIMSDLNFNINSDDAVKTPPVKELTENQKQPIQRMSDLLDSMLIILQQIAIEREKLAANVEKLIALSEPQQAKSIKP